MIILLFSFPPQIFGTLRKIRDVAPRTRRPGSGFPQLLFPVAKDFLRHHVNVQRYVSGQKLSDALGNANIGGEQASSRTVNRILVKDLDHRFCKPKRKFQLTDEHRNWRLFGTCCMKTTTSTAQFLLMRHALHYALMAALRFGTWPMTFLSWKSGSFQRRYTFSVQCLTTV